MGYFVFSFDYPIHFEALTDLVADMNKVAPPVNMEDNQLSGQIITVHSLYDVLGTLQCSHVAKIN